LASLFFHIYSDILELENILPEKSIFSLVNEKILKKYPHIFHFLK